MLNANAPVRVNGSPPPGAGSTVAVGVILGNWKLGTENCHRTMRWCWTPTEPTESPLTGFEPWKRQARDSSFVIVAISPSDCRPPEIGCQQKSGSSSGCSLVGVNQSVHLLGSAPIDLDLAVGFCRLPFYTHSLREHSFIVISHYPLSTIHQRTIL
ncbi:hypothetical protein BO99DRAFT_150662 [Aspergillus violaceofuscus CBS 115571]|uniref:Uncharacterized protein n=1 Tax=Aspergillus violaceofuscus (strain CBS 115571) TaxID=1450538 RepID=A0A2V5H4E8_ASPV1|nr:hypothetical protein BO99DRAFT_150662 [Aspergillus violaceofuscus CBS 115571]